MNIGHYAKSLLYVALAAGAFLVTALGDDAVTSEELVNLGVVLVGAVGVYLVPNLPNSVAKYGKGFVAFATAALVAALSFWSGGITPSEWLQIGIAALAGIGVVIVPNEPAKEPVMEIVNTGAPIVVQKADPQPE